MDIAHLLQRLADPFNPESRFYWPAVAAVFVAMGAHTLWYVWRPTKPRNPVRDHIETIVYWVDIVVLVLLLVTIATKVPAWVLVGVIGVEWLVIGYIYLTYARPRFAAYEREQRLKRYIPDPKRRAARR